MFLLLIYPQNSRKFCGYFADNLRLFERFADRLEPGSERHSKTKSLNAKARRRNDAEKQGIPKRKDPNQKAEQHAFCVKELQVQNKSALVFPRGSSARLHAASLLAGWKEGRRFGFGVQGNF